MPGFLASNAFWYAVVSSLGNDVSTVTVPAWARGPAHNRPAAMATAQRMRCIECLLKVLVVVVANVGGNEGLGQSLFLISPITGTGCRVIT